MDSWASSGKARGSEGLLPEQYLLVLRHGNLVSYCSLDLKDLTVTCQSYHLLHGFTFTILTAVYIPPHVEEKNALVNVRNMTNSLETEYLKVLFIAARKSDRNAVLLLLAYKQKLKHEDPVHKVVQCQSEAMEGLLWGYLELVEWSVFKNLAANINEYATAVTDFFSLSCTSRATLTYAGVQVTTFVRPSEMPKDNAKLRLGPRPTTQTPVTCGRTCTIFKKTTINPKPKKGHAACLNDYHPVPLTFIILKCFK
eukprot:g37265.t1